MAAVLGSRSTLPGYFTGSESRANPVVASFEKELGYFAASIRRAGRKAPTAETRRKLSNTLFSLWNSYGGRLASAYFTQQLLATGDLLYQAQEYHLAGTHCYGRYLCSIGLGEEEQGEEGRGEKVAEYFEKVEEHGVIVAALRALIGDATCRYFLMEKEDPKLMYGSSRSVVLSVLLSLRQSTCVALQREPHYWLVYNGVVLIYTIGRKMMLLGYAAQVLEYLLWGAVCMESSVPLMAVKYLQLRVNLYMAVCQCYYDIQQPYQAELFARRGLDKVHELAQLEHQSSSEATKSSEEVFRESALKLGVMVFKRSVLESRKKSKSIFRPKVRPTIRDQLQLPTPRSPTEKLLSEMFPGFSAQFLALLETLTEGWRRPLEQAPPTPVPDLDQETVTDIYQELFCVGTDLSQKVLNRFEEGFTEEAGSIHLMSAACRGGDMVPLEAVVQFVRLAHSYEQREVFDLLAERVVRAGKASADAGVRSKVGSLELILAVDSVLSAWRVHKTATDETKTEGLLEEPLESLQHLSQELHIACSDPTLFSSDFDLLLDSALLLWEAVRSIFSRVHSHEYTACRQLLYLSLLQRVVDTFHLLGVWQVDPVLHGEVSLKLGCLREASADLRHSKPGETTLPGKGLVILYDRSQLLECLGGLREGIECIKLARRANYLQHNAPPQRVSELEILHTEFLYAITRVQLKLASTIPPPPPHEGTQKPSSLRSKVRERKEREEQWQRTLSGLTAVETLVESEAELRARCGKDRYLAALLHMLQASTSSQLRPAERETLLEESFSHLQQLAQEPRDTPITTSPSCLTPPPPLPLHCTDTTVTFKPAPFQPKGSQKVAYYALYGRRAAGSCVKVRLADGHLPGLGVEVAAGKDCTLEARGLQPNEEYIFAVAAYTSGGELVGGAIGQTGQPLVATHHLPLSVAWGHLCQCAYTAGVHTVAKKAAAVLWRECVGGDGGDGGEREGKEGDLQLHITIPRVNSPLLSSAPTSFLRHFVQSVFIYVQVELTEGSLLADRLCEGVTLRHKQWKRLELVRRMLAGLEVAGMLNDASLCLQAVVVCYGLLAPLIQHSIVTKPLVQMLLHCLATLGELPESLLAPKHTNTAVSLHHMAAVIAYHVGKVLLTWHKKALFSLVADNARGLLLTTIPSTSKKDASSLPGTTATAGGQLHQSSTVSTTQDLSMSSYATISSGLPGMLLMSSLKGGGGGRGRRKGRKKVVTATDQIPDESKSAEYKGFEAFLMANHASSSSSLEDLDLTGQEDPVILHAVIATIPSQLAYKEVHKFRRRPQYLEFFVHLAGSTVSKGHMERVLEWGREAFTWLARRNELLLSPKPSPGQRGAVDHGRPIQSQKPKHSPRASLLESSTALVPVRQRVTTAGRRRDSQQRLGESMDASRKMAVVVKEQRRGASVVAKSPAVKKSSRLSSQLSHSLAVAKITRDDLETKACSVLQSLLPEMWRNHKCRKRLRIVSSEELPWRSQANLLLATCCLDGLLRKLSGGTWGEGGGGEGVESAAMTSVQPHWLRFDTTGVIIDGIIPVHPDALPGQPCKASAAPEGKNGGRWPNADPPPGSAAPEGKNGERWPDADPPPGSAAAPRPLPLQQAEVCQLLSHLQRAVVLAHRGRNWILLQNACRVLWNTITTLINVSERDDQGGRVVYGLACKPLYSAASGLTDLLLHCRASPTLPEPPPTSLKFTPHLDNCNMVDLVFIKRLVFLAVHTLHSNQHWEKMIDIATRFDDVTNHYWSEELVPVITSAQEKLSRRVETHKGKTTAREALEPAAHLDPGPEGHDVYGGVGHALTLVSVPLNTQATQRRMEGRGGGAERSLMHCRRLLARYLTGSNRDISEPPSLTPSPCVPPTVDLPPLPASHLPTVISAYDEAIVSLIGSKQRDTAVMAMHELGSVMFHSHNSKLAGHWWMESLSTLLQTKDPLNSWRKLAAGGGGGEKRRGGGGKGVPEGGAADPLLESCGVWGCLLGGIMATKLAEYVYRNELDIRLEYTLLAAALFKSVLSFSLPHPTSDLDYATYPHQLPSSAESGQQLLPGVELFSDPYRCDLPSLLSSLRHCSQDLITWHHVVKALPVLWLYQHLAHSVCRNVQHTVMAKILKLLAMCELCLFSECLALLAEIQSGAKLPQSSCEHNRPPDTHVGSIQFNNSLPLNDPKNLKALNAVMERPLSPGLASLYCESTISWLTLAQAKLFTAMAATCTAVPRQSLLRAVGDQRPSTMSAPPTQISAPSSATSVRSGSSMQSSRRSQRKFSLATDDIKLSLLDHTERLLVSLCHQLKSSGKKENMELRVRAYLQLAQVSLTLHHSLTAVQLSLAAMRLLQKEGGGGKSPTSESSPPEGGGTCGVRLWLECRVMLARSLMERGDGGGGGLVDCVGQCEEGVGECEACGEVEMTAELHHIAAMHALTCEPCHLAKISSHAQNTLQLLESLPELSPWSRLLRCQASILLADVSCMLGGATWEEMAQVFRGLAVMLKKQLEDEAVHLNIFQPQRVLFASVQLRLAHLSTLLAASILDPAQRMEHAIAAKRACEEGREVLRESVHGDPCLAAELAFHYGWLQNSNLVPGLTTAGAEALCADDTSLLHATRTIADCAADYRLAFTCYCELAQSFAVCSKQPFKPPLSDTPQPTAIPPGSSSSGDRPKASQSSNRARSKLSQQELETERMSKAEREWVKERGREAYCAWALTKTALQTQNAVHNLQLLTSELHNKGATTPIPDKVLTELPDFALLDLCQSEEIFHVLTAGLEEVPIEIHVLAPSAQLTNPAGVSWFRVAVYTSRILQQCFWQKSALSSDTDWALHYHSRTASVYTKCSAVIAFLTRNFPQFARNSSLPPPPSLLSSLTTSSRPPATSALGAQSVVPPQTVVSGAAVTNSELHLTAGGTEVMVIWHRPFPTSSTQQFPSSDVLLGLFALNFKAIKTHPPTNIGACGAEVYCVKTSFSALSTLHSSWEELAVASKAYLDSKAASRPVSRSPSKQKKVERAVKTPPELQSKLMQAVQMLCATFSIQKREDQLPRIEPHTVASVTRALRPLTHTTIKGDVYYFLTSVFRQ